MSRYGWLSIVLAVLLLIAAGFAYYFHQAWQADRSRLGAELQAAAAEVDQLTAERRRLEDELAGARQRLAQRNSSADQLETELDQALEALAATEEELRKATGRAGQLQTERDRLGADLAQANGNAERLSGRQRELEQTLAQARQTLEQQHAELEELSQERESAATRYHQAREQLALQQARAESASETVAELEARLAAERAAMDTLENRLQDLSNEKETLVSRLEDGTTVIKLPESILFDSGSAIIGASGRQTLQFLATALASFPSHQISIQGHSDSRTISPALQDRYPTNWELSASRAASAVRVLRETGIEASRMQAVGYADTRPLVAETDAASRGKNRRIEVLLYPDTLTIRPQALPTVE